MAAGLLVWMLAACTASSGLGRAAPFAEPTPSQLRGALVGVSDLHAPVPGAQGLSPSVNSGFSVITNPGFASHGCSGLLSPFASSSPIPNGASVEVTFSGGDSGLLVVESLVTAPEQSLDQYAEQMVYEMRSCEDLQLVWQHSTAQLHSQAVSWTDGARAVELKGPGSVLGGLIRTRLVAGVLVVQRLRDALLAYFYLDPLGGSSDVTMFYTAAIDKARSRLGGTGSLPSGSGQAGQLPGTDSGLDSELLGVADLGSGWMIRPVGPSSNGCGAGAALESGEVGRVEADFMINPLPVLEERIFKYASATAPYEHVIEAYSNCDSYTYAGYQFTVSPLKLPSFGQRSAGFTMTTSEEGHTILIDLAVVLKGHQVLLVGYEQLAPADIAQFENLVGLAVSRLP
jgi:hypothetical protein